MKEITNIEWRREFGDCFYMDIPLDGSIEEVKKRIADATSIEHSVKTMLDGGMDLEEMIEEIEPILKDSDMDVDNYLEVVEDNMNYTLIHLPHLYSQ